MFGSKYQWILAGKYADDWWRGERETVTTTDAAAEAGNKEMEESGDEEDDDNCSDETLRLALDGYICADILILSLLQQQPTVADLVGCVTFSQSRQCLIRFFVGFFCYFCQKVTLKFTRNLVIIIYYKDQLMQLLHCRKTKKLLVLSLSTFGSKKTITLRIVYIISGTAGLAEIN